MRRYAALTGRDVSNLRWYQALALWKSAVFCEAIYGRHLRGEHERPVGGVARATASRDSIEVAAACLAQA